MVSFVQWERTNVHRRSGRQSVIAEDLKDRVDTQIRENRQFTVDELHEVLNTNRASYGLDEWSGGRFL